MRVKFIFSILFLFLLLFSCKKENKNFPSVDIKKVDNITFISNPEYPQKQPQEYLLKEELTIGGQDVRGDPFVRIKDLEVDSQENIYVLDIRLIQVKIFDKSGQHIRSFGREGQGPGDFARPKDLTIDEKRKMIYILDSVNKKISRYRFDGTFDSDIKLDRPYPQFFFIGSNENYFIGYFLTDEDGYQKYSIRNYSPQGEATPLLKEFLAVKSKIIEKGGMTISGRLPFDPARYFAFNRDGYLYTGMSDNYEINLFDQNLQTSRVILKKSHKKIKISQEEIDKYVNSLKEKERKRGRPYTMILDYYEFPEYHEVFTGLWIDESGRLWVKTTSKDEKIHIDVFNQEGIYEEERVITETSDSIPVDEVFKNPVFKGGCIYVAVKNQDDIEVLKKYRFSEKQ